MTSYRKHTQLIGLLIISSFSLTACETINKLHLGPKLGIKIPIKKTVLIDGSEKQLVSDLIEQGDNSLHKNPEKKVAKKSEINWGTGKFIKSVPRANTQKTTRDGKYTINFDAADIGEVSKIILSDMLHVNYVLSPKVRGQVTLQTTQALKKAQLLPTLEMLLQINGAVLVKQDNMYRIEPAATALGIADASQLNSHHIKSGYQIKVIPLSYIGAADMADIIKPIVPAKSLVRVDVARNLLLVAGNGSDLSKVLELVKTFDVNFVAGMSFALFPLENIEVDAAITDIEKIFNKSEKTPLSGMLRFVAIKHLNAILVISQQQAYLKEAETWIRRLDQETDTLGGDGGVIVYRVQHVDAIELAATLNSIISGGSSKTRRPSVAAGRKLATISNKKVSSSIAARSSGTGNKLLQGVSLIADEPNNALIVLANQQQYRMLKKIIERLDVMPLQVLIDATIVSVKLEDNLSYGVQWKFKNSGPNGMEGIGLLGAAAKGLAAAGTGGFSYGLQRSSSDIRMVFDALAKDNKINVLSSPSLMVLNNQTATIKVGDSIPIRTSQSTNTNSSLNPIQTSSIKMLDTGIILTVKPRVNASGIVILKIKQNVDTATITNSSKIDSPTILKRQIESTVAVVSGESVVLGGLISEEHTYDNTGMPFFKDIPYIGWLFGSQSKKIVKNELIVVITPRVVGNKFDARQVTDEFKRKLTGIYYDEGKFKLSGSQVKRGYDGLELRTDEQNAQDLDHRLKPWEEAVDKTNRNNLTK